LKRKVHQPPSAASEAGSSEVMKRPTVGISQNTAIAVRIR
jgi:hypothetical protein